MRVPRITLTDGERLSINRRRAGMTQKNLAAMLGVTIGLVAQWENDKRGFSPGPVPPLRIPINLGDWMFIERKRLGLALKHISHLTGLGTRWINQAERGAVSDPTPLVLWWQRYKVEQAKLRQQ